MAARVQIEQEPNYSQVTARLLLDNLRREALSFLAGLPQEATQAEMGERYPEYFQAYIKRAAQLELVDSELTRYDLDALGKALLARARPAVHLPRPADPVRPLLHPLRRHPLRAAAGVLHARGDGPGDQRDRPRGAGHRVLRAAVAPSTS
jgi:hypothetical protein